MTVRRGSCHCGSVRYEVYGPLREVIYCHCTQCRKQTGHFVAATRCENSALTVTGSENLTWYAASDDARRGFCKTCGAALFWARKGSDMTSLFAGALEHPSGLQARHHIFAQDKGDYYEIADGLPVFQHSD